MLMVQVSPSLPMDKRCISQTRARDMGSLATTLLARLHCASIPLSSSRFSKKGTGITVSLMPTLLKPLHHHPPPSSHPLYTYSCTERTTLTLRYQYDVLSTGQLTNRAVFAHSPVGLPDGVHCDTAGNVYAGTGDGVRVWDPSGKALGEIYIGGTSANFQFAGKGRMVVCAETELYYVELNAEGAGITDYNYSDIQS